MQAFLKEATFVTGSVREFTNAETGEVRVYAKALFAQDGEDPIQLNIEPDVLDQLEKLVAYDLTLSISSFDKKFYVRVTDANVC